MRKGDIVDNERMHTAKYLLRVIVIPFNVERGGRRGKIGRKGESYANYNMRGVNDVLVPEKSMDACHSYRNANQSNESNQ